MAGNRTLKLSILADVDDLNKKLKAANGDVETSATGMEKFGKMASAAFAAAAVAAAAYAVKIGVDGVKAAIADEQSQLKLAQSLEKATGATKDQIAATEISIDKMARATGVADDQLRPALARLALSTNSTSKAQELLALALDISTQTGKPLEGVANALGKAYDGNTAALGKLGVGLSSAELKAMSFTDVQQKLTDLFGGAAAANAETFQGRMDRLKVAFDEGVETIGVKLLPIIEKLLGFVLDKVIPGFNNFIKLFDPLKKVVEDNKETFAAFGAFIVDYIVPVITQKLGAAISFVATVANAVLPIIGGVIKMISSMVSVAIDGINALIRAYNAIPLLPNIPTISKPSIAAPSVSAPKVTTPGFTSPTISTPSGGGGSTGSTTSSTTSVSNVASSASSAAATIGSFNAGSFRAAESASMAPVYNINVTGALDKEGVARQIVEIINESSYRGGGGPGSALIA